jgi:hypothetical protein
VQHIMCEYPVITRIELNHFDKGYLSPTEVEALNQNNARLSKSNKARGSLGTEWEIHKRSAQVEVENGLSSAFQAFKISRFQAFKF